MELVTVLTFVSMLGLIIIVIDIEPIASVKPKQSAGTLSKRFFFFHILIEL